MGISIRKTTKYISQQAILHLMTEHSRKRKELNTLATILKRGNSFQIIVSCGYDSSGKQIRKTMSYQPPKGMSPVRAKKEAEKQAILVEEQAQRLLQLLEDETEEH